MKFLEERIGEILKQLDKLRYPYTEKITNWEYSKASEKMKAVEQIKAALPFILKENDRWGGIEKYYAFRNNVLISEKLAGQNLQFALRTGREGQWDATNPQFLLYVDGKIAQGLDVNHQDSPIGDTYKEGEQVSLFLMAYTGEDTEDIHLDTCLRILDKDIEQFYYDLLIPYQAACLQEKDEKIYWNILNVLNETVNILDMRQVYSSEFYASLRRASEYLKVEFYDKKCGGSPEAEVYCVGHTHIDIAWLWTLAVTQDKAVRSFSTVVKLMEQHPEYIFMSSQPQLYQYVKDTAPEVYEKIKELVAEGRWEVEGGMWLEPDCNIPSGESFVRQFMYGKRFFREEFGKNNEILWLPDVFGYSAALPQIMQKCGIHYFMTTKISWNESNKMPYDSFYWEGIDGTKVLTHFIPTRDYQSATRHPVTSAEHTTEFTTNYNGYTHPSQVKGAWQRYQQKDISDEVLLSYGYGDGGGGTTNWMIESVKRMNKGLPGMPKTRFSTARAYFDTLERRFEAAKEKNAEVPLWSGELYLEYHRATYTSMARNKRFNRQMEFLLENAEWMSVMTGHYDHKEEFDKAWIKMLRNQFHDILPGSSIEEVYKVSKEEYESIQEVFKPMLQQMLQENAEQVLGAKGDVVVYNPNGLTVSGMVKIPLEETAGAIWPQSVVTQHTADGNVLTYAEDIPAKGYRKLELCGTENKTEMKSFSQQEIENQYYRILLNEKGQITSFYDKEAERELIQENSRGNVFMTYEDKPHDCDNWNLYEYYKEKSWEVNDLVECKIMEQGPIRYGISFTYRYLSSVIEERLFFYPNQRNVDMEIDIDWKEDQIFLKLLYPVKLFTREATFEIQYGNVTRNMIRNTSWDLAKCEVCTHKWMDISENNSYGISFLNDCKYGVSIDDNVVGLSLIKAGMYPNPHADREKHHLCYSIYPHMGNWREAGTIQKAYVLNNPLQAVVKQTGSGTKAAEDSYMKLNRENVILEVVKPSEEGTDTVVRMYEAYGQRTKVELTLPKQVTGLYAADMLEMEEHKVQMQDGKYSFWMAPYEITTFKLKR